MLSAGRGGGPRVGLVCCAVFLVVAGGCSDPGPTFEKGSLEVFPVSGSVFVGGKPAAGASVVFMPDGGTADEKAWTQGYPRAVVGADGSFKVSTYGTDDGAPAGKYKLGVTWQEEGEEEEMPDKLQGKYANPASSKLTAEVKGGGPTELPRMEL